MKFSRLHIYSPTFYHDHAFIVGDKKALESLRDAINVALANGNGKATSHTADGEGFDLEVYYEEESAYWDNSLLPYTDKIAEDHRKHAIGPWALFKKYKKDKVQ